MQELSEVFGAGGALQRALPGFKPRRQQARMAQALAASLEARETLVVEAGTGTGKTFAYLVPALLSGRRVLISTGTRTLQDQLFSKDLPLVAAAIGRPARIALLKGRANYLCLHHLAREQGAGEQLTLDVGEAGDGHATLAAIGRWARTTAVGDLAEVAGLSDSDPLWSRVTATRDSCLGGDCPEILRCHLARARRAAQEADIVIVNHHLLLADLALKEEGFADLLGGADAIIIDEAHQLPDLAAQHFGVHLSSRQLTGLLADVQREADRHEAEAGGASQAGAGARRVLEGAREAQAALTSFSEALPPQGTRALAAAGEPLRRALHGLTDALELLTAELGLIAVQGPLMSLTSRLRTALNQLSLIGALDETEGSRVVEVAAGGFGLRLLPYDTSARFRALRESAPASWIFTSATLSVGEDFGHFTQRLGLADAATLKIDSPFDYERQALLYLPKGLPAPTSPAYPAAVIDRALPLIEASGGGAFVLFTSHRALKAAARHLRERWGGEPPCRLLVQGDAPREHQLKDFREDGNAVLLGTASFWEGVDVQGEALRLVIIEKLPFASPEDPLVRARIEHLTATGADPFREYQLPAAVLALKQGVGRLIRSEDDHGAVVICDPRMQARSYGKVFLAALPPMTVTLDEEDALRFLRRHAPPRRAQPAPVAGS